MCFHASYLYGLAFAMSRFSEVFLIVFTCCIVSPKHCVHLFLSRRLPCSRWFRDVDSRGQCVCQVGAGRQCFRWHPRRTKVRRQCVCDMMLGHVSTRVSVVVLLVSLVVGWCWWCLVLVGAGCVNYRIALRGARVILRRGAFVSHQPNPNWEFHDTSTGTTYLYTISARQIQAT